MQAFIYVVIINSQQNQHISIFERSAQFGDGCFTTMRVADGKPAFWLEHLNRLKRDCERLYIQAVDWDGVQASAFRSAQQLDDGVLKVLVSRGASQRGYGTKGIEESTAVISTSPYPGHYYTWQQQGVRLGLSSIKLAQQPLLAGLKHLNRLEQVLIKREVEQSPFADMLVLDTDGHLVETSAANLFWRVDAEWFTPNLEKSGIEGVMRNLFVDFLTTSDVKLTVGSWRPEVLQQANAVFICNSLMQIVPVASITLPHARFDYSLSDAQVLQNQFNQKVLSE